MPINGASVVDTQHTPGQLEHHSLGQRQVVAKFSGGSITSSAGGLLLREVEISIGDTASA
jgi:hypothetical protein